ncbi:hypothetical protein [Amycolatopsis magusensis]|uniref:Uncharacterized protein n=1 Tax=Amycolatopsis magusensis TaxID=882444 RepID=A0ABS4PKV2_9PSEU|nr:hypothetical protein [Amycolatopsis magusensis]MBP2180045.1 hypothetical protein [Amycolatopsis magusensis]MDI5978046.1 hypothetical protein [Amycolatopsis magusensis]
MTKAVSASGVAEPDVIPKSPIAKTKLFFQLYWKRGAPGQRPTAPWALNFAYGMWLLAFAFKLIGSSWDMSWHFMWLRDDLAPPHLINTVGTGIVVVLVAIHSYTGLGCDRRSLRLMQAGTVVFLIAGPLDVLNHRVNGLDLTAWSPSHLLLYIGTGIMLAGAIDGWLKTSPPGRMRSLVLTGLWFFFLENTFFPNGQQEYGILELRSWERGEPYAEPTLLEFAAEQIGRPVDREAVVHFAMPIEDWVYPVWGIGVMALILAMARHTVRKPWTGTTVAVAYVAYRALIWPLLLGAGFPTSTVPFYLIFVGLAVDLAFRIGRGHRMLTAGVGGLLVTAFGYAALWLQSQVRPLLLGEDAITESAPPIEYLTVPFVLVGVALLWALASPIARRLNAPHKKPSDLIPDTVV